MRPNRILFVSIFASFFMTNMAYDYSNQQAKIAAQLSAASYCNKEEYAQISYPVNDFQYTNTLYDPATDIQGFVGYSQQMKSIYVSYRGSSSLLNWISDFEIRLVPYETFPECNCEVHRGFYKAALNLRNQTLDSVSALLGKYPDYGMVFTGHSLASISGMIAMEMIAYMPNTNKQIQVYNFGSPRMGDALYADFVSTKIPQHWRFTHYQDIVPHIPPTRGFGYYHSCTEIYENELGELTTCSEINCEDGTCANQFSIYETSFEDHHIYLGYEMDCESNDMPPNILELDLERFR